ncbi:MAG TPA: type II toxin-antitoxin system RelE/ParE family toxin [Vicinamibacterales bacterium]
MSRRLWTSESTSPLTAGIRTASGWTRWTLRHGRIQARVLRFSTGNLGDHKSVGRGVWEARVMFGPGYRIYFGKDGAQLVLLLLGGDKSTQTADVRRAHES